MRLVAFFACLASASALANPAGGVFAGPTAPTGAAIYWNPAALAAYPEGTFGMAELTGIVLGATWQREPEDPASEPAYDPVSFTSMAPDLSFITGMGTPLPSLRLLFGGYSPTGIGANWPEDGPQRYHSTRSYLAAYALTAGALFAPSPRFGVAVLGGPSYLRTNMRYAMDFGAFANGKLPPGADLFEREDPELQGEVEIAAEGYSAVGILGAWAEPIDGLELGVGVLVPRDVELEGTVAVTSPPALKEALPSYRLAPRGDISFLYPMAWTVSTELAVDTGDIGAALTFQYARRSRQRIILGAITEAEPEFIEGRQVSVKGAKDDWMVGLRVEKAVGETTSVGARVDFDPRYLPKEVITPINLDFTTVELSGGLRWEPSPGQALTISYGWVYIVPIDVTQSAYNPRAPAGSGFDMPSARGHYSAWAHKLVVSYEGLWPAG